MSRFEELQTGFEPALYTIGQLKTQDGWGGTTATLVQNTTVQSGLQALGLNASGLVQQISNRVVS